MGEKCDRAAVRGEALTGTASSMYGGPLDVGVALYSSKLGLAPGVAIATFRAAFSFSPIRKETLNDLRIWLFLVAWPFLSDCSLAARFCAPRFGSTAAH